MAEGKSLVLDIAIDALTMKEVLARIECAVGSGSRLRLGMVNAAKIVNMANDPLLYNDVTTSDLVLADGMSVVWAAKLLNSPLPERIAGIDLMFEILKLCEQRGRRVYLLGARQEICAEVARRVGVDYPNAVVAGFRNGYFDEEDVPGIVAEINASDADVLFVAMTSPLKERFMSACEDKLEVPVIHGVGGSFDVYAGHVSRAPKWMQSMGLEWFYRVLMEPRRMFRRYLVTNCKFIARVFSSWVRGKKGAH